jgi:hypothetical protein
VLTDFDNSIARWAESGNPFFAGGASDLLAKWKAENPLDD